MWLERQLNYIRGSGGLVYIDARKDFGAAYVIQALHQEDQPLIWVEISTGDDPVSQGNKLSDAVSHAVGARLFGYGLPTSICVPTMAHYLRTLGRFTVCVSGVEFAPELADLLIKHHVVGNRLIFSRLSGTKDFLKPSGMKRLDEAQLALTTSEIRFMAGVDGKEGLLQGIAEKCQRAYICVSQELSNHFSIAVQVQPAPEAGRVNSFHLGGVAAAEYLSMCISQSLWREAFEIAVAYHPERVAEIIGFAGKVYFRNGLVQQFWKLLSMIPHRFMDDEEIQFWRYSCAITVNKVGHISASTSRFLENNPAAKLRGLVAMYSIRSDSLAVAKAAFEHEPGIETQRYYGVALSIFAGDPTAIRHLKAAMNLAEEVGDDYQMVACAWDICNSLVRRGSFRDADAWGTWALELYYSRSLREELRRLEILAGVAYCRIAVGQVESVFMLVEQMLAVVGDHEFPDLVSVFSTLGDFFLVTNRPKEALQYYHRARSSSAHLLNAYSNSDICRALINQAEYSEALSLASRLNAVCVEASEYERLLCALMLGTAYAYVDPEMAIDPLVSVLEICAVNRQAPWAAQASLHLAKCHIALGNVDDARSVLSSFDWCLRELGKSGWRLFGGPEELFRDVWLLYHEDALPLELTFLGGRGVRVERLVDAFPLRWCEILTLLALHPQGLSGEQLALMLYGDDGNQSTLKSTLSRLRRLVPISSRPYRIGLPFSADFVEIDRVLQEGRLREALEMYRGPLLEASQAPGIVEARVHLEEALREAVLMSGDAGPVVQLARRLKDDLEVWEQALRLISRNDPQFPLVRARVRRIRREWGEA